MLYGKGQASRIPVSVTRTTAIQPALPIFSLVNASGAALNSYTEAMTECLHSCRKLTETGSVWLRDGEYVFPLLHFQEMAYSLWYLGSSVW